MNVFISWSGPRSRALAESLRSWLPRVLQACKPWMSEEDISVGSRWLSAIQSELSKASLGILCITPENQSSPWLLFEAGALSKAISQSQVFPLLLDLSPSQLTGPLAQFQASETSRSGIEGILFALNKSLGPNGVDTEALREIIDVWWPKLESGISKALHLSHDRSTKRPLDEILDELASNTREQLRRENIRLQSSMERDNRLDEFLGVMNTVATAILQSQDQQNRRISGELTLEDGFRAAIPPNIDPGAMKRIVNSLTEMAARQRAFEERILNHSPKSEAAPGVDTPKQTPESDLKISNSPDVNRS